MTRYSILHLTDIHFGQNVFAAQHINLKAAFFEDLEYIVNVHGPIHLVAFTGDMAFSGQADQFEQGTLFLNELRTWLSSKCGTYPILAVVPGNHDLVRPAALDPVGRALLYSIDSKPVEDALGASYARHEESSPYKHFLDAAFSNFESWRKSRPLGHIDVIDCLLPGDFITKIEHEDLSIGFVGLNSTFLQFQEGNFDGRLLLLSHQLNKMVEEMVTGNLENTDVNILLMHQPRNWLREDAIQSLEEFLFPPRLRLFVGLFGHMHDANLGGESRAGAEFRYFLQGKSFFGLEKWGNPPQEQRFHGYSIVSIEKVSETLGVQVTPRAAQRIQGQGWRFNSDLSGPFEIMRGQDSTPMLPLPRSLSVVAVPRSEPVPRTYPQVEGAVSIESNPDMSRMKGSVQPSAPSNPNQLDDRGPGASYIGFNQPNWSVHGDVVQFLQDVALISGASTAKSSEARMPKVPNVKAEGQSLPAQNMAKRLILQIGEQFGNLDNQLSNPKEQEALEKTLRELYVHAPDIANSLLTALSQQPQVFGAVAQVVALKVKTDLAV